MANILPKISDDFNSSYGEYLIFNALKKLPDDWNIYHSVNWQKKDQYGIVRWGEADFLIFNPLYGVLVAEVKSGGIDYECGNWIQTRLDTLEKNIMKNPFKQADRSKYKLIEELDNNLPLGEKCFVDKIVWFPSISNADIEKISLPMEYNKKLILSKDSLDNPLEALMGAYQFYSAKKFNHLSYVGEKKVKEIIMPNFKLVPSASNIKDEADYIFYQLTNEQEKVLNFICDQKTVAIQGSAGTGKTFIAVEQAKRFAKNGKVLFLCFNRYLNNHLNSKFSNSKIDFYSLHSFISKHSGEDIYNIDRCKKELEKIELKELGYEFIVIDEAQDFSGEILEIFYKKCTKESIKLIIFYDKNQLIFQNELPNIIKEFDSKLTLLKNCRNTVKIASSVNSIFNMPIETNELSVLGIMPALNYSDSKEKIILDIINKIDGYIKSGFKCDDIVILTLSTEDKSILSNINKLGNYQISSTPKDNQIFFTTSKKFKGLESNIVIVVDFEPEKYVDYNYRKNLYVSLSRARQRLELYAQANEKQWDIIAKDIEGDMSTVVKIARKFKMIMKKI